LPPNRALLWATRRDNAWQKRCNQWFASCLL